MGEIWRESDATIGCLRVQGIGLDPIVAKLRVTGLLETMHLHPQVIPRESIVCIRKIRRPLPGRWQTLSGQLSNEPDWERGLANQIEDLARHAARPFHGPVPQNAEAVLFTDRAELLACLASDWLVGELLSHWWWQDLFRSTENARLVASAWLDAAEFAPLALQYLAKQQRAIEFAHALDDEHVEVLLERLMDIFGLQELYQILEVRSIRQSKGLMVSQGAVENRTDVEVLDIQMPQYSGVAEFAPPWYTWVPERMSADLDTRRQLLVVTALMLARAPTVVRSSSFAQDVRTWLENVPLLPRTSVVHHEKKHPYNNFQGILDAEALPRIGTDTDLGAPNIRSEPGKDTMRLKDKPSRTDSPRAMDDSLHDVEPFIRRTSTNSLAAADSPPLSGMEAINTELGGLFYLVNMGIQLALYADFTSPRRPGINLPIWDFITLVGRHLLGSQCPEDPIWDLLARLSDRSPDLPPGKFFEPPREWRLPPEWLLPFAEGQACKWYVYGDRLGVNHPDGFCVIDVQVSGDPRVILSSEMRPYDQFGMAAPGPTFAPREDASELERWLGWLLPFVTVRLQRALGLRRDEPPGILLLRHRARVEVTATRLDLFTPLSDLPLSVRFAGLDRDPGWVPAAGRFVAFHFEA